MPALLLLLAALSLPLRAFNATTPAPWRLPRATPGETAALRQVVGPGADLAAGPLAEQLRFLGVFPEIVRLDKLTPQRRLEIEEILASARRQAALAVARISLDAANAVRAGKGSPEQLSELLFAASQWDWYGEPAVTALARLRGELLERKVEPLLRDPFSTPSAQGLSGADTRQRSVALEPPLAATPRTPVPQAPPPAPQPPKKSDFAKRAVTASLLVPGLIGLIHLGGTAFIGLALAISLLSLFEFAGLMKAGGRPVSRGALLLGGAALSMSLIVGWPLAPVLAAVAGLSAAAELWTEKPSIERAAVTVFGAALFGLLPAYLALLRALAPHGGAFALSLFGAAWASDTMAYVFGKRFGHRKIAPRISPNKTWEGTLAGFFAALVLPLALALAWPAWLPLAAALKLGLVMGTLGQLGGYVNSLIKRANGAKDSGRLLPGHGGIIDRFDSFLLSAAVLYFLLRS